MIDLDINKSSSDDVYCNHFLNHMKNCFIVSDNTQQCEHIFLKEFKLNVKNYHNNNDALNENNKWRLRLEHYMKHTDHHYLNRIDSNRLKKFSKNKNMYSKYNEETSQDILNKYEINNEDNNTEAHHVLKINYQNKTNSLNEGELFSRSKMLENTEKRKSVLSILLESKSNEINYFKEFAKFDNDIKLSSTGKVFKIHFQFSEVQMEVGIIKTANIYDLIGLACFKYTIENRKPPLKHNSVTNYCLKIIEDDGEIDCEFPPLEYKKCVNLFGFKNLALVEKDKEQFKNLNTEKIFIDAIIHFTDGSPKQVFRYESSNITFNQLYNDVIKFKSLQPTRINYNIEHEDKGLITDLNKKLCDYSNLEFYFYRENSVRENNHNESVISDIVKSLYNKCFEIDYLSKWKKVSFRIVISQDELDLEEISNQNRKTKNEKPSVYSFPIEKIVDCLIIKESLDIDKCQVRVVVWKMDESQYMYFETLDLETTIKNGNEIKSILINLINYRNSSYLNMHLYCENKKYIKWSRKRHINVS